MNQEILQELVQTNEIIGSFVFDTQATILAAQVPSAYKVQLPEISSLLLRSISAQTLEQPDWDLNNLFVRFASGGLFLRRCKEKFLVALCGPQANHSLIDFSLKIASTRLQETPSLPPTATEAQDEDELIFEFDEPVFVEPTPIAAPASATPEKSATDTVLPGDFVKELTTTFAVYIGPMAKLLLKKSIKRLGLTKKTLTATHLPELYPLLEEHLTDLIKRDAFRKDIQTLFSQHKLPTPFS